MIFGIRFLELVLITYYVYRFELMAEAQRDLTPEQAAMRLRQCDEVHYLDRMEAGGGQQAQAFGEI